MTSVTFESFIKQQRVEIPAIQRDYVQGRGVTTEEQDKREAFVSKLINAVADTDAKPLHLEFIYGDINETSHNFIPLDGQQRLTTLLLLHWVVWNMSSLEVKNEYPLRNTIAGFEYKTRISSGNFCRNLINKELLTIKNSHSLGETLRKQPWFSEDWNLDATITAMISMIDFIEQKLRQYSENEISNMLIKLCSKDNVISFEQLNMANYGLTDSLYIKMNARGKFLTPFENWKSEFIKFLESELGNEAYPMADRKRKSKSFSYRDYFCYSIEHQWTDLFWSYVKEDYLNLDYQEQQKQNPAIDKMFMNLFNFLCMYYYYAQKTDTIDYFKINASTKRKIWQNKEFVTFLFKTLDTLYKIDHSTFFDNLFYIHDKELPMDNNSCKVRLFRTKQCNLFKLCAGNGASMELTDLLLFYALVYYCNEYNINNVTDDLKSYIRSVRNYFENDIQNLRTRTMVQLNLRVSEFSKYNERIKAIAKQTNPKLSENECIIDDCGITHGNTKVFQKSIESFGYTMVIKALNIFCSASPTERIRLLTACGFQGTYLGDCIGRNRYFFGNTDKWDVLFISDWKQLSECFNNFTSKIATEKDASAIINESLTENCNGFVYYMLKYDGFLNANDSQHHFAIKGDVNDVDWVALGSYSSNPGTAYHTDPIAVAVERILVKKYPTVNLALYKQYRGKAPLSIVKDKILWEELFSIVSRKEGWVVVKGLEYMTQEMQNGFCVQKLSEDKYLIPNNGNCDMVQLGVAIMEKICQTMEENHQIK